MGDHRRPASTGSLHFQDRRARTGGSSTSSRWAGARTAGRSSATRATPVARTPEARSAAAAARRRAGHRATTSPAGGSDGSGSGPPTRRHGWATRHSGDGLRLTCVRTAVRARPAQAAERTHPAAARPTPFTVEVEHRGSTPRSPAPRAGLTVLGDAFSLDRARGGGPTGRSHLVHRFAESVAERRAGRRPSAARPRGTGTAADRDRRRGAAAVSHSTSATRLAPVLRPGLRRHPLALGRCPARPLRRSRRPDGGHAGAATLHAVPHHRAIRTDRLKLITVVSLLGAAMTHFRSKRLPRPGPGLGPGLGRTLVTVTALVASLGLGAVTSAEAAPDDTSKLTAGSSVSLPCDRQGVPRDRQGARLDRRGARVRLPRRRDDGRSPPAKSSP